jgi:holliday junction DNA helicase RuvA
MISALTGELIAVDETRAVVDLRLGQVLYELLVPAADVPSLRDLIGTEVTFYTLMYLEGDPNRGNLEPRLLGFLRREDKRFFELFTTVKGIGPKTALRALSAPIGEIAHAIETRNSRFLIGLDGIGKRSAELVIAELSGKVQTFMAAGPITPGAPTSRRTAIEEDAIAALMQLGERRSDAELLLERAKKTNGELRTTDALLREMLRLRG